jgi:hypothetical protein
MKRRGIFCFGKENRRKRDFLKGEEKKIKTGKIS